METRVTPEEFNKKVKEIRERIGEDFSNLAYAVERQRICTLKQRVELKDGTVAELRISFFFPMAHAELRIKGEGVLTTSVEMSGIEPLLKGRRREGDEER